VNKMEKSIVYLLSEIQAVNEKLTYESNTLSINDIVDLTTLQSKIVALNALIDVTKQQMISILKGV